MANTNQKIETAHPAVAKALNLPVSTKHCIEICRTLRYKDMSYAKKFLEEVIVLKRAVPFKRFVHNIGHKKGMSTGRFPAKAAMEVLKLLKSVEANANFKGLNTGSLKITKLVANKASIPSTGKRHRGATKRTHLEVEVKERAAGKKVETGLAKKEAVPAKKENAAALKEHKQKDNITPAHTVTKHKHEAEHDHKQEAPAVNSAKAAAKAKAQVKAAEEPSSVELLKRAQQKAADLNRQEKERKETEQVTNLYEELQKKGSLRSTGARK